MREVLVVAVCVLFDLRLFPLIFIKEHTKQINDTSFSLYLLHTLCDEDVLYLFCFFTIQYFVVKIDE